MRDRITLSKPPPTTQEELDAATGIRNSLACGPAGALTKGSRLSRRGDPETSKEAAAKVEPELRKSQAWLLEWFDGRLGGDTDRDLVQDILGLDRSVLWEENRPPRGLRTGSGIRTRRKELAEQGYLELVLDEDGKPTKRQGCRVWRLK